MRALRKLLQWLHPLLHGAYRSYSSKERHYRYGPVSISVLPGVFHPGLFHSTKTLLTFLKSKNLAEKSLLELGAGTGLIAIWAAKVGAVSTASDISRQSIRNIETNVTRNDVLLTVIESDLFKNINQKFDYVIVNPPYYPRDPTSERELAWYCGADFGYFREFFGALRSQIGSQTKVFMVLSEDCDLDSITGIASSKQFVMQEVYSRSSWGERNSVYQIVNPSQ